GSLRSLLGEAFFRCKYALCRLRLALTRCCCPIERFYRSEQSGAQSGFGSKRIFMATLINRIAAQFRLANQRRTRALFIADASKGRGNWPIRPIRLRSAQDPRSGHVLYRLSGSGPEKPTPRHGEPLLLKLLRDDGL